MLDSLSRALVMCIMSAESPLQRDMFTGEWIDNRTAEQRRKDEERDARIPDQLPLLGADMGPPTRQTLEPPLAVYETFGESADLGDPYEEAIEEDIPLLEHVPLPSAYALYLDLVQLSEETAATLWIDPLYEDAYAIQIDLFAMTARHAGLTNTEIQAAVQIGAYRGRAQRLAHQRFTG